MADWYINTILPPLLLTLRRWQHWWWEAPCPCSYRVEPIVHPGSLQRNHRLIYFPCLYFIMYIIVVSQDQVFAQLSCWAHLFHQHITHGSAIVQHEWLHCPHVQRWAGRKIICFSHVFPGNPLLSAKLIIHKKTTTKKKHGGWQKIPTNNLLNQVPVKHKLTFFSWYFFCGFRCKPSFLMSLFCFSIYSKWLSFIKKQK